MSKAPPKDKKEIINVGHMAISPDPENDIWLTEPSPRGAGKLYARITPGGARSFYFSYSNSKGKREYLRIGPYDKTGRKGLTLAGARDKFHTLSKLYRSGVKDVKEHIETEQRLEDQRKAAELSEIEAAKRAAEIEANRMTVAGLFEAWDKARLSKRRDAEQIQRMFNKDVLPAIGDIPAHLVRKGHVMQIVDAIEQRGAPRVAKIVFNSLRTMFKFALTRDFVEIDPTAGISKTEIGGPDVERDRFLSDAEIRTLSEQMPGAGLIPTTQAAIWIYLATGCRAAELLRARWEYVDIGKGEWLIPAEHSKNGDPITVSLSDFALKHFRTLEQFRRSEWIFPARYLDGHVCVKTITKQVGDRQRQEAMTNRSSKTGTLVLPGGRWTIHDLRRTAATLMADIGIKPEIVDRCLNHREQNRIRRTYQRYSYQAEMAEAWQLLGERLEALTSCKDAAMIIPLRSNDRR